MLVHENFVFLEMRKTGSTFLAAALERELPAGALRTLDKHGDWGQIPPEATGRPVLAYVRNPWDWYVSWYHDNMRRKEPNGFFMLLSDNRTLGFAGTVSKMCELLTLLVGADLYTTFFRNLIGDGVTSSSLTIGRFESLIDDLEGFLSGAGVELSDEAFARMRAASPLNPGTRGPYREYYDPALRDLVGASCRSIIERFDYRF